MRKSVWIVGALGLMLALGPAYADDKADCLNGIKKLQAIKKPTDKQKKKLADAEQEQMEADWDECKKVLKQ